MRRTERLRLADVDHENHTLLAGLEVRDLPDQLLDLGGSRLGVDPGLTGVVHLDGQGFQVDHFSLYTSWGCDLKTAQAR